MLARTDSLPTGEGWAFELKLDGFRALADTHDGFRVVSRREWDMSDRVPELRGLPEGLTLSGTYKANTCFPDDTFADPAPPKPYGAALSAFNGTDANGTLSLYVQDFGPNLGRWEPHITTVGTEITDLQDLVSSMGIHHGITNALNSKLQNVRQSPVETMARKPSHLTSNRQPSPSGTGRGGRASAGEAPPSRRDLCRPGLRR